MEAKEAVERNRIEVALVVCGVPEHLREGLLEYVIVGRPTGSFLEYVLANDLMGAFGQADEKSRDGMFQICTFLYNDVPEAAKGNRDKVRQWIDRGGLRGVCGWRQD